MKVIINLYKALLCFLSLFSTCKSKLPDTIIIVFPEIGIDGIEYDDVLPKNIHKLYLNTWTNDQFDKLKKIENILEYKTWYLGIISKTKLKDLAFLNIAYISVTLDTFQLLSGWLKDSAF